MDGISADQAALTTGPPKRRYVAGVFDRIARRYDLLNLVISIGQTSIWRWRALASLQLDSDADVLDVGCGTGSVIRLIRKRQPRASIAGMDISFAMLLKARREDTKSAFIVGDVSSIPLQTASRDLVTTFYTTRNFPDLTAAVREMLRVIRPGGRLLVLDSFPIQGRPVWRLLQKVWMRTVVPILVRPFADPGAYRYLAASIEAHCTDEAFAGLLRAEGVRDLTMRRFSFGSATLFSAGIPLTEDSEIVRKERGG